MIAVSKLLSPTVAGTPIAISKHIKSLGVTLDDKLSFDKHVDNVCPLFSSRCSSSLEWSAS